MKKNMNNVAIFAALLALSNPTTADDFFGAVETSATNRESAQSPWRHRVWLQQKTGYGYRDPMAGFNRDRAELTRTETELYGELDWRQQSWRVRLAGSLVHDWLPDLADAGLWHGYEFTEAQRDNRRWRWEGSDSFVSWQDGDWWIRGGYLTLAWGEAETLKVTDVLARRDQRWPGQEDLEELRLPVPAAVMTWRNTVDLVVLPEMPTDRLPPAFAEFDPYIGLRDYATGSSPDITTERGAKPGLALRWQMRSPGLDVQWLLADVYSFDTAPTALTFSQESQPRLAELTLKPWRQQIAGAALQSVRGNWLFKTEQAWHRGVRLAQQNPLVPWEDHNQWRAMVAAEFSGVNDLTVTTEFSWSYTQKHTPALASDQWQTGQALRVRYTLFNERLAVGGLALRVSGGEGNVLRLTADWELSDQTSLGLALVEYQTEASHQLLYPYHRNDVILATLRRGF